MRKNVREGVGVEDKLPGRLIRTSCLHYDTTLDEKRSLRPDKGKVLRTLGDKREKYYQEKVLQRLRVVVCLGPPDRTVRLSLCLYLGVPGDDGADGRVSNGRSTRITFERKFKVTECKVWKE